jgi:hypothetical protein
MLPRGPVTIFLNETCIPELLDSTKQHLKNHKNTNISYLDIQYLNKISKVALVCPKFIYFVFTPQGNYIIILITSNLLQKIYKFTWQHNLGT